MPYSETNNVPYHINQLCTIPYTPMIYHAIYTNDVPCHIHQRCTVPCSHPKPSNDVPYHVPILNRRVNRPQVTVANPEYQTVGLNRPHGTMATNKPSGQTDLTAPWQLINRRGQTDLTALWQSQYTKPSGKPDLTVVEIIYHRWVKPTSRHRGKLRIPNRRVNQTSRSWK